MVGDGLKHGWNNQRVGHPIPRYMIEHSVRAEGREHDMRTAAQHQASGHQHVGEMEHRRHMQANAAFVEHALGEHRQAGRTQIGMAQHHAFGPSGGTASVEDSEQVVASGAGVGKRH